MTAVGNVSTAATVAPTTMTPPSMTALATAQSPSLLPDPKTAVGGDAMSMLYLIASEDRQLGMTSSSANIKGLEKQRDDALQKEKDALAKEAEAAKHKSFWDNLGSVFGDIAKAAAVVASCAAAVATCGAASPLAAVAIGGAILSTAGFVGSETGVLQKLGVSADVANILNTAMSVAGGVMSLGTASAVGAASDVATVSAVVSGTGSIGQGASVIASGHAKKDEDEAAADEVANESTQDSLLRTITRLIAETKDSDNQSSQYLSTVAATKGTLNATSLTAASMKG
jgi:hypothetical protein